MPSLGKEGRKPYWSNTATPKISRRKTKSLKIGEKYISPTADAKKFADNGEKKITIALVLRHVGLAVVRDPGRHRDKVGHEGRNHALNDGRVTPDDVLVVHLRLVELGHHWPTTTTSERSLLSRKIESHLHCTLLEINTIWGETWNGGDRRSLFCFFKFKMVNVLGVISTNS